MNDFRLKAYVLSAPQDHGNKTRHFVSIRIADVIHQQTIENMLIYERTQVAGKPCRCKHFHHVGKQEKEESYCISTILLKKINSCRV